MKPDCLKGVILLCLFLIVSACSRHDSKIMASSYEPSALSGYKWSKAQDLSTLSKCATPASVWVTNGETQKEDYVILKINLFSIFMNRQELAAHIVNYTREAFNQCKIAADEKSSKIISISIQDVKYLMSDWTGGAKLEIRLEIPEIKYSSVYAVEEWSPAAYHFIILTSAIETVTWQMIADPKVQDYLLCR